MTAPTCPAGLNLENLRIQLTRQTALLTTGFGIAAIWTMLPEEPFPMTRASLPAALATLGVAVFLLLRVSPGGARHLLVWGLTGALVAAMALFETPWLPVLALTLPFISSLLVKGGGLLTTGVVASSTIYLHAMGARSYALPLLLIGLGFGTALAWAATGTLYTALEWAWTMQRRADDLLAVSRDRQGELNKALKSLQLSTSLLQHTQQELIVARRQAEEARRQKERFAASVSHELRTPLSIILGFSELIYVSPEIYGEMHWPPKLRQAVYQIYRNSRHLLELIDDLLDLSRLEIVGFTLDKEPTSIETLVREAAEIGRDFFQGRKVTLEVSIEEELPLLEVDRTRIRQVLLNLLNNAARHTQEGTVRVDARRADGEVIVAVSDTGPGIPPESRERIFDEFYQVDGSVHHKRGGFGLGLAICRRFMEAHGGRIWVESEEGRGSSFFLALPIPGHGVPISSLRVDRPLEPSHWHARPSLLVVDRDPTVATLLRRHLPRYDVISVEDADALRDAMALYHPQAVIHNVPPDSPSCREAIDHISVPVIECSLPSHAWIASEFGVSACLTKPITMQHLLQAIGRVGHVRDVLIVDDDRGFCQLVEQMLTASGRSFSVRHAYDGAEGLRAIEERRPDLVLLDLIMPDLDGFHVLESMRQEPELADLPVVLLTAAGHLDDVLERRGTYLAVRDAGGLSLATVLRCLRCIVDAFGSPERPGDAAPEGLSHDAQLT